MLRLLVAALLAALAAPREHDVIHDGLQLAALVAVLVFPLGVSKLARDEYLDTLGEILAYALGTLAEHRAIDEVGFVLPLVGLVVLDPIVHGDAEAQNGHARSG